jgi:hypothetical protein
MSYYDVYQTDQNRQATSPVAMKVSLEDLSEFLGVGVYVTPHDPGQLDFLASSLEA